MKTKDIEDWIVLLKAELVICRHSIEMVEQIKGEIADLQKELNSRKIALLNCLM